MLAKRVPQAIEVALQPDIFHILLYKTTNTILSQPHNSILHYGNLNADLTINDLVSTITQVMDQSQISGGNQVINFEL